MLAGNVPHQFAFDIELSFLVSVFYELTSLLILWTNLQLIGWCCEL